MVNKLINDCRVSGISGSLGFCHALFKYEMESDALFLCFEDLIWVLIALWSFLTCCFDAPTFEKVMY